MSPWFWQCLGRHKSPCWPWLPRTFFEEKSNMLCIKPKCVHNSENKWYRSKIQNVMQNCTFYCTLLCINEFYFSRSFIRHKNLSIAKAVAWSINVYYFHPNISTPLFFSLSHQGLVFFCFVLVLLRLCRCKSHFVQPIFHSSVTNIDSYCFCSVLCVVYCLYCFNRHIVCWCHVFL